MLEFVNHNNYQAGIVLSFSLQVAAKTIGKALPFDLDIRRAALKVLANGVAPVPSKKQVLPS